MVTDARKKVDRARCELIADHPFFGTLVLMLEPREIEGLGSPAATDGKRFFFDPELIKDYSPEVMMAAMAHEVLHFAFGHTHGHRYNRSGKRDPMRWNIAGDMVINQLLSDSGFKPHEHWVSTDPGGRFIECGPKGKNQAEIEEGRIMLDPPLEKPVNSFTAEELYPRLPEPTKVCVSGMPGGEGEPCDGNCGADYHIDFECGLMNPKSGEDDRQNSTGGSGPKKMSDTERDLWQAKLKAAAQQAKRQGTLPAGMEEHIDGLRPPQKNWREELHEFVQKVFEDWTYMPPDRRTQSMSEEMGEEFVFPSMSEGDQIANIVIAVDTSGSVSTEELRDFLSEVQAIAIIGADITLMYCDAQVDYVGELQAENIPDPSGRGGTSFRPVFDKVEELGLMPECLVYFTDSYGSYPDPDEVHYPTMWVINNEDSDDAPLGKTVRYQPHETY